MFLRAITIADDRGQPLAIIGAEENANRLCHSREIAQISPKVNPLFVSLH
jgi:hypothetical protein